MRGRRLTNLLLTRTRSGALVVALAARVGTLMIIGYTLAGLGGALIVGVAAVIGIYQPQLVALYAVLALLLTGLLSVFESPLGVRVPVTSFVAAHPGAIFFGRLAGVLFLATIVTLWLEPGFRWRPPTHTIDSDLGERRPWDRSSIAVFALVGAVVLAVVDGGRLRWVALFVRADRRGRAGGPLHPQPTPLVPNGQICRDRGRSGQIFLTGDDSARTTPDLAPTALSWHPRRRACEPRDRRRGPMCVGAVLTTARAVNSPAPSACGWPNVQPSSRSPRETRQQDCRRAKLSTHRPARHDRAAGLPGR